MGNFYGIKVGNNETVIDDMLTYTLFFVTFVDQNNVVVVKTTLKGTVSFK